MAERQISKAESEEKAGTRRKGPESQPEKLKEQVDVPEATGISTLSAGAQAALMTDARLSHPANTEHRVRMLMGLQQSYGNAYVQRLLNSRIQPKLVVNAPDDANEREADRVADAVVRRTGAEIQRQEEEEELQPKAAADRVAGEIGRQEAEEEEEGEEVQPKAASREEIGRQPAEEEEELQPKAAAGRVAGEIGRQGAEEEEEVQPKAASRGEVGRQPAEEEEEVQPKLASGRFSADIQRQEEEGVQMRASTSGAFEASEGVENRIGAARGGGQPLPDAVRDTLEPGFGHDFSGVRIHADADADALSRQLGALAFTTGQDVFFREDNYRPDSDDGKRLIAHELTHVVQQSQSVARKKEMSRSRRPSQRKGK